ncbi:3-hydroxyacyl-CoA dehydrogenase NAD-binding domain-containing protein [Roseovarius indicus]|uniref:Fatty acid oxidation complex subunit alpha n=1 Tax=Roseovarius indicus TaxID=540747 RepID=A0A5P3A7N7_9RHOB|nr:3-hydroxyacyl-CoA dehydrogenase NAD-binding domain-containing protein [Roseovarius indicus]QEW25412.1 Fatty acid oxidation complex subunit alpha [Roseovarius indicus]SFE05563.1 3-hydroxyacyl-CoA dehydrogenase / enoyl-CoA hydratase / 3-hydroxybutyryl-CoA epimerase [Roseovarius indicus]
MTQSTAAATTPATGTVTIRLADHDFDSLATALRDAIAQLPEGILLDGRGGAPVVNDPHEILRLFGTGAGREAVRDWATRRGAVLRALETCGVPVACIWSGPAFGPGWEIMLAAHTRFLDGEAKSSAPRDLTLGLLPGAGAVQRLARILGVETASSLLMGKPMDGAALETAGLWTRCETGTAETAAKDWLAAAGESAQPWDARRYRIAGGTGATAPHAAKSFALPAIAARGRGHDCDPAPLATLRALYEGSQLPMDAALAREAQITAEVLTAGVATSRIRTFVVNKARAEEGAARPDAPRREVRKLGVLGAGMMGAGIARAAAEQGIDVILLDRDRDSADRGRSGVAKALEKAVAKGRETDEKANATLSRIHPTADQSDLAGAELVIEAVFEQTDLKREVTQSVLPHLADDAIIASNTSTISIDTLAGVLPDPARFIGLHFFSPVDRMPLVEIIKGRDTSDETLAAALDFTMQLGKTPIVVNTSPGFFTSRIFCTYIDEAMAMLAEGVAPALIENAARMIGAPVGPLAVTDEVSLDLQKKVIDQAEADGLDPRFLRARAKPVVERMVALGRLGRKSGGGFHDFPEDGPKRLWPGLAEEFPPAATQPDVEEVKARLLTIQALESARCIEEGVVERPADADLGSVLGVGFPPWTGGVLSHIDTVGATVFVAACDALADAHGDRFRPSAWLRDRAATGTRFHEGETP